MQAEERARDASSRRVCFFHGFRGILLRQKRAGRAYAPGGGWHVEAFFACEKKVCLLKAGGLRPAGKTSAVEPWPWLLRRRG